MFVKFHKILYKFWVLEVALRIWLIGMQLELEFRLPDPLLNDSKILINSHFNVFFSKVSNSAKYE